MTKGLWTRIVKFLGSAGFATSLLGIVALWSVIGSFIPQYGSTGDKVAPWVRSHAAIEPFVRAIGLHTAFSAPLFLFCVALLGVSTAFCAWERTKLAVRKVRILREARGADAEAIESRHDFEIAVSPGFERDKALDVASDAFERLGFRVKRENGVLASVSPTWTVWGSPVFHWSLLALIVVLVVGNVFRSEGLMGVAVGQLQPDLPASYGVVEAGPLHVWADRGIRVDGFETKYTVDGVDRGPTPSVTVYDGHGHAIKSQRVYPNHTLSSGALTIYPSDFGLAAYFSATTNTGANAGSGIMLVDFSTDTTIGTTPVNYIGLGSPGQPGYRVYVSVPLDKQNGSFARRLPAQQVARIRVENESGYAVQVADVRSGGELVLPNGYRLRLDHLTYYARLEVVDDASIPLLMGGLVIAMFGLGVAVLARQQIVIAGLAQNETGNVLVVRLRQWRNSPTTRSEIERELSAALGGTEKESTNE